MSIDVAGLVPTMPKADGHTEHSRSRRSVRGDVGMMMSLQTMSSVRIEPSGSPIRQGARGVGHSVTDNQLPQGVFWRGGSSPETQRDLRFA
jgi:hypothetical protein